MDKKIVVAGLGYVGLANVAILSKFNNVIGFDIDENRVKVLNEGRCYLKESALETSLYENKNRFMATFDEKETYGIKFFTLRSLYEYSI